MTARKWSLREAEKLSHQNDRPNDRLKMIGGYRRNSPTKMIASKWSLPDVTGACACEPPSCHSVVGNKFPCGISFGNQLLFYSTSIKQPWCEQWAHLTKLTSFTTGAQCFCYTTRFSYAFSSEERTVTVWTSCTRMKHSSGTFMYFCAFQSRNNTQAF